MGLYPAADIKISLTYKKMGFEEKADQYFRSYTDYCEKSESIYKSASLAGKFSFEGEFDKAMEQLKIFSNQQNYQYWIVVFLDMDPLIKQMKDHPEYDAVIQKIMDRFWEDQVKLRLSLEGKGLL